MECYFFSGGYQGNNMKTIIKSLVGSRAHGLERPDSDFDWRGVFVLPTDELLWAHAMAQKTKTVSWIEGDQDDTSYEIGHFLKLATNSNPSVLEILVSPEMPELTEEGQRVVDLFPKLWSTKGVLNAFGGYAHNNLKKFVEGKDGRPEKFAVASIRVSIMGVQLLKEGHMTLVVEDQAWKNVLHKIRDGYLDKGTMYAYMEQAKKILHEAHAETKEKTTDIEAVKELLLDIRHNH